MGKPSNSQFREIFDSAAPIYDASANSYTRQRRMEFVVDRARGSCLEVGAGTGEISRALSKDHAVTATDISPKMVEEIRKKMNIPTAVCDAEALPFNDASFDTVICGEAIYYLDEPVRFIAEAYRVLRPHGVLLITSASPMAMLYDRARMMLRLLGFKEMYFEDGMHRFPRAGHLHRLIRNGGFKIEETYRFIIIPLGVFDFLNRILEKTPLKYAAVFTALKARRV